MIEMMKRMKGLEMKIDSVRGYMLGLAFINIYKEDNKLDGTLSSIYSILFQLNMKYKKNGLNVKKQLEIAWNKFSELTNNDEREVSVLTFLIQLIIKNPNKEKHKLLTNLAFELSKDKRFSKEETDIQAKKLVNEFYSSKR